MLIWIFNRSSSKFINSVHIYKFPSKTQTTQQQQYLALHGEIYKCFQFLQFMDFSLYGYKKVLGKLILIPLEI
jgi:hypothetical protein